ncbi:hypothetical protein [Saccharothrix coeruleofusca]|uniref:Uncharacterized protein n=1 Tax=Saccharothrix coeruleofusca TaxID=33919 RepID=A0A918AR79_9PSEU|nr:hypothetical protein [Saccharothrix coeruleofusca]MBP2335971.1 hypothetical protein [Saccharothrix coeruleofusca]GGP76270.1 hypothetical protein GCM10010185_57450 [Saccharothrix coeruleofusca]
MTARGEQGVEELARLRDGVDVALRSIRAGIPVTRPARAAEADWAMSADGVIGAPPAPRGGEPDSAGGGRHRLR